MKRILSSAAVVALLTGCVVVNQQAAEQGRTALIGKSRGEILACAGVPNGTFRDGGTEFFAYAASGRVRSGGSTTYLGSGVFVSSGSSRQSQCIVTLALQNGRVVAVNYRSSGGALIAPDEACGNVVKSCL